MNISVRSGVKQSKRKSDKCGNFFLEYMTENGMEHIYSDNQKLVEDIAEDNLMLEMLMKALETLTDDERFLIKDIYFNHYSEQKISRNYNVSQQAIHKRKMKILKKLKKILDN